MSHRTPVAPRLCLPCMPDNVNNVILKFAWPIENARCGPQKTVLNHVKILVYYNAEQDLT